MKRKNWSVYVIWMILMLTTGWCAWMIMRDGVEIYQTTAQKPLLAAPGIVFYVVWTILYGIMGVSVARIRILSDSPAGKSATNWFIMQLIMNFFWGQVFFNSQAFGFAFVWLLVLLACLVLTIWEFYKVDRVSAWLQIPYLLWVIYCGVLNFSIWLLNR